MGDMSGISWLFYFSSLLSLISISYCSNAITNYFTMEFRKNSCRDQHAFRIGERSRMNLKVKLIFHFPKSIEFFSYSLHLSCFALLLPKMISSWQPSLNFPGFWTLTIHLLIKATLGLLICMSFTTQIICNHLWGRKTYTFTSGKDFWSMTIYYQF